MPPGDNMKATNSERKRRGISALDVFAVILVILCAAGAVIRILGGEKGVLPITEPKSEDYNVSFEITGTSSLQGGNVVSGETLYDENGNLFGTVKENVTVTPAVIYVEDAAGKYLQTFAGSDNGDSNSVDVRGAIASKGYFTDKGFLVGGKTYVAPNYEITLHSSKATFTLRITDISKAGK